jgi:glycine/D-amino acid oxidase-like deaminating enzyme
MQIASFKFYHGLAKSQPSSETGVKLYPATEYFDAKSSRSATRDSSNAFIRDLMPDFEEIPEADLPRGTGVTSGIRYTSLAINPTYFLPWLQKQLEAKGVRFIRKEVENLSAARSLSARRPEIIINASGLGAKVLAGDDEVMPVRGQTMFIKSDYEKLMIREGSEYTYVIPRPHSGGVIVGGVKQPGRTDGIVEVAVKKDILCACGRGLCRC